MKTKCKRRSTAKSTQQDEKKNNKHKYTHTHALHIDDEVRKK